MKKACRLLPCSLLAVALLAAPAAWAQIQINSSPSKVGSGARALGMGSAFIAIADDATATSWNPAGLTQLERPEISLVYSWKRFDEEFGSRVYREMRDDHGVNLDDLNYASVVYPVRRTFAGRNLILSLNYQRQYDFDRNLDYDVRFFNAGAGGITRMRLRGDYAQRGSLSTITPAVAFELTNRLSLGLAVNLWDQSLISGNKWRTHQEGSSFFTTNGVVTPASFGRYTVEEEYDDFECVNYTVGLLYKPTARLSFGMVYHTRFTAEVEYTRRFRSYMGGVPVFRTTTQRDREITFPDALGIGAAYRFPNDKLTLSLDVTRRDWDKFVIVEESGLLFSPMGATPFFPMPRRTSGVSGLPKHLSPHDPTYTIRLGAEYVFVNEAKPRQDFLPSLRAGIFYDPEPSSNRSDVWYGLGPAFGLEPKGDGKPDDYYGVALGAGLLIRNRVNLDIAYQFRWGDDVRKDTFGLKSTDADVRQHYLYFSTVIYF
ncbi:MAG TPA: outer membrane protein transport protein [Candidatus Hydrogenedentes bacterium]|nr:outer membrane protein transport protein [Candidatus Hydrogenedentota bacterium]